MSSHATDLLGLCEIFFFFCSCAVVTALFTESSPTPADDVWLEVYRLPKEAWLKELEPLQQMLEQSATQDDEDESPSVSFSLSLCVTY